MKKATSKKQKAISKKASQKSTSKKVRTEKGGIWQGRDGNYYRMLPTMVSESYLICMLRDRGIWLARNGNFYWMAATKIN